MRFGILTQYYPPEMGAPQARLSDLARRLVRHGHEVIVLTAMPNYPKGRIDPGYGGVFRSESRDGVLILRSFIYPTKSLGMVRRLSSYFSFVFSSILVGAVALPRLDYLITESPPLFLGIAGFVLSRLKRARLIFNVSDLWPHTAVQLGVLRPGLALRCAQRLETFCYRKSWLVTGQTRGIVEDIRRRFPSTRAYHLSNGVDTAAFSPERRSDAARRALMDGQAGAAGGCVAVYAGLHGMAQGLDQILQAASRLQDVAGLSFVLVGDGAEKEALIQQRDRLGLRNVRFLDPAPREEIPALLASADIALVPLRISIPEAVPSKVYEAMGVGVPLMLVADGEAARLVGEAGAGVMVEPGDIDGLTAALRRLAQDPERRRKMGALGREAAVRRFDREAIATGFLSRLLESGT